MHAKVTACGNTAWTPRRPDLILRPTAPDYLTTIAQFKCRLRARHRDSYPVHQSIGRICPGSPHSALALRIYDKIAVAGKTRILFSYWHPCGSRSKVEHTFAARLSLLLSSSNWVIARSYSDGPDSEDGWMNAKPVPMFQDQARGIPAW